MKKKSPRGIPDFSSKGPKSRPPVQLNQDKGARPNYSAPKIKPPATSSKSGRRGG
ncbi:MAG: hypothetical protein WD801_16845 [Gemmatimonadaceae bacterium]